MMDFILQFFDSIWALFASVAEMWHDLLVTSYAWFVIAVTKAKIYMVGFAWDVAQEILNQLDISGQINQFWGTIDSQVMGALTFLRLPEALNMILNAYLTRYVLAVIS